MEIKVGDLKIEALGTEYFCTICNEFSLECYKRQRGGNLFVLKVSVPNEEPLFLLLSRGHFKKVNSVKLESVLGGHVKTLMSGTKIYDGGKITKSGWISFSPVLRINEEDIIAERLRKNMNKDEKELLNILIDQNKLNILTEYLKALSKKHDLRYLHQLVESVDLGVWTTLKPLLHIFLSDKVYTIGNAQILFIPLSFKARFRVWGIEFNITKAKPDAITWPDDTVEIQLGRQRRIHVREEGEHVTVFYELPHVVYGYDQYRQDVNPPISLSPSYFREYKHLLLKYRLGNVLFDYASYSAIQNAKEAELPEWAGELKILQGRVFTDGKDYYVNNNKVDIIAYHPSYGVLVLLPGTYKLVRVQCMHT
jgi:hypothetical protein